MLYINMIFQDYLEKLRQIRQQNYQERRNVMGRNKNEVKTKCGLIYRSGLSLSYSFHGLLYSDKCSLDLKAKRQC